MSKDNNKKTPKVRFPGFNDDWEQRKLGDVAQEFKSGNSLKADEIDITGDYPVYGGNGLRGYTSTYNHDGEYALIGRQGALCGNMNYSAGKAYFTEHAVVVRADENNDTSFLYYMLDTMNLGQYSDQSAQPGLAVNKLVKLENSFPKKEEQQQIGAYFRSLDHLITLHQRKLEKLKEYKKGMLKKMFPKSGEKVPEVRFPGFDGEWEKDNFSELMSSLQNNTFSRAELVSEDGFARNIHYGDILVKFGEVLDVSKEYLPMIADKKVLTKFNSSFLRNGDIVIADTAEDSTVGKCSEIVGIENKNVLAGLHTMPYRPKKKFAPGYLGYYLNSSSYHDQLRPLMQGIKVTSISKSAIRDTYIVFPKTEAEQQKIGSFFHNLDHLIALQQKKIESLKEFKKGCLQQMFV